VLQSGAKAKGLPANSQQNSTIPHTHL